MLRHLRPAIAAAVMTMLATQAFASGHNLPVKAAPRAQAPQSDHKSYTAAVGAKGKLVRGSGATAASQPEGTGTYEVDFAADVSGCAYVATLGQTGSRGTADPGMITVVGRSGVPNGIFVTTGDLQGNDKNRSFQVDVGC
jgi:hypothetical protein